MERKLMKWTWNKEIETHGMYNDGQCRHHEQRYQCNGILDDLNYNEGRQTRYGENQVYIYCIDVK